ncbi:MAG: 7-cyano-7-deazaguanine synthase [Bacteroidales bacterium]|nr:7-cyano-7-deazaguanine synthase [Bacteroidales bacterium]
MMKVLVGMSGGLDSAAAAIILKQQGCEVIAVSIDFYTEQVGDIPLFKENIHDAAELCRLLNIPHHTVHAGNEFNTVVFDYFIRGYLSGITPFPCIVCNNKIKWPLLIEKANGLGCELIATGHYAKSIQNNLKYYITEGVDKDKDQSFFLWGLNQEILKRAVFPLGNLAKGQVKEIVKK